MNETDRPRVAAVVRWPVWSQRWRPLALAIFLLVSIGPRALRARGDANPYVAEAQSFIHGRLDIDGSYQDISTYQGKKFVAFPPLPALLLVPVVLVLGVRFNTPLILSLFLVALSARLLFLTIEKTSASGRDAAGWLTIGFVLGSGFFMVSSWPSGVWYLAQLVGVSCCIACLYELVHARRPWLLGLLVGGAFLSRQLTIVYAPFVAAILWFDDKDKPVDRRLRSLLEFSVPMVACVATQLALNARRFAGPFDTGYELIDGWTALQPGGHGMFSPVYFLANFITTFVQGPHIDMSSTEVRHVVGLDTHGTSLTFASPFIFLSLRAAAPRHWLIAAWSTVAVIALVQLCYYTDGFFQVNCARFTLDFLPIVVVLAGMGWHRWPPRLAKASVVYAVALNVLALIVVVKVLARL